MPFRSDSLDIELLFDSEEEEKRHKKEVVLRTLKTILPEEFFDQRETHSQMRQNQQQVLQKAIPLIICSEPSTSLRKISFMTLSKQRANSFKFFFEMLTHWLTPGSSLNVCFVNAADFKWSQINHEVYTLCEVIANVNNQTEFEEIHRNFPLIQSELALGLQSEFYAQRILELKGMPTDDRTLLIHSIIATVIKRFPLHFDTNLLIDMQHLLVTCREDFKAGRLPRHLARIIIAKYLFRKRLIEVVRKQPHRRHIFLKIFPSFIQQGGFQKRVLGVFVGVNLLREQENFGERHLLRAIQHYIPSTIAIENSFYKHRLDAENIYFSYVEIEKKEGTFFTSGEIRKLRRELANNIKNRIEYRLHNVFMPRNEEEVMRNILTLANQIKFVRDFPQVLINFDEQAYAHLYFTVILARLIKPDTSSVVDLFKQAETSVEYLHDRTKIVGHVRKKYPKEATVFRLKLPKEGFLRADQSIDLYKARHMIVKVLTHVLGEIRDYNGGMISKQHELLLEVRKELIDIKDYDELMLENFFYSLAPVVARALVDPKAFKRLFQMLLEGLKEFKQEGIYLKVHRSSTMGFALLISEESWIKETVHRAIQELHIPSAELACAHVKAQGNTCLGYMCCMRDLEMQEQFFQTLSYAVQSSKSH